MPDGALVKAGVRAKRTLEPLVALFHLPVRYRDYSDPILDVADSPLLARERGYCRLRCEGVEQHEKGGVKRIVVRALDARGKSIEIAAFGNVWPWIKIRQGDDLYLWGQVSAWEGRLQLKGAELVPAEQRGRVAPVYRARGGVSAAAIAAAAEAAAGSARVLDEASCRIAARIAFPEAAVARRVKYEDLKVLLRDLHAPATLQKGERARAAARLLCLLDIRSRAWRLRQRPAVATAAIPVALEAAYEIARGFPHPLTGDQRRAIAEIVADLRLAVPMRRLVSGDVGTGKTVTYASPMIACAQRGRQIGVIVPNVQLAHQIANDFRGLIATSDAPAIPVRVVGAGQRVARDEAGILVSTTALVGAARRSGYVPDVLVVDEQHKLSREQREALLGPHTHLLEVTATPVPRTSAVVLWGGMDVSVLRECPVQKEVKTYIARGRDAKVKGQLLTLVRQALARGEQVALIYPLRDRPLSEGDEEGGATSRPAGVVKDVETAAAEWSAVFPGQVVALHGKMTGDEKVAVLDRVRSGELPVLVSSTVLEVGVTIPKLTLMIVVNADRYGVAQLHQMRGRLARLGGAGIMVLYLPEEVDQDTHERMKLVCRHNDGFELAERDMNQRGFGDLGGDSDEQTGAADALFAGVRILPADLKELTADFQSRQQAAA